MKVCMITGTFPPIKCGVGDYSNILCNYLSQVEEVNLSIITTEGINKNNKYKVYDVVKNWDNSELKKIINKINDINPDIVHIQYPTLAYKKNIMINMLPYFLHKKYKIITTIHEYSDNSTLGKLRIWPNIFFSDAIIVVDKHYISDIKKVKFLRKRDFYYVNIGSNIPKSNIDKKERDATRNKILKNNCNRILGYFGFINRTKGIESILYAINNLKEQNKLKTIFLIIGELKQDDEYHNSIINLINKFHLNDYIYITGYLKSQDVGKYINASDFMVLPFVNGLSSKNGSFLASIQEGKHIVTTMRNGKKIFNDLNVEYLNTYNDTGTLKNIIELNQKKGVKNYNGDSSSEFSWKNIVKKHVEIYRTTIKK